MLSKIMNKLVESRNSDYLLYTEYSTRKSGTVDRVVVRSNLLN